MDETEHIEERLFAATFLEVGANGTGINWRYWVEQMPTLTAAQAARLMSALDPDKHCDLRLPASTDDTSELRKKAELLERLAVAQGRMAGAPRDWLLWARQHRLTLHDGFVLAVETLEPVEKTPALVAPAPANSRIASVTDAATSEHWKMRVQAEAAAEWMRLRAMHCNPTRASIRPHLLKWCRENDVKTHSNINPSDGYLRTHVLSAAHWTPPAD